MLPVLPPLHVGAVVLTSERTSAVGCESVTLVLAVAGEQPLASVTVTVYKILALRFMAVAVVCTGVVSHE